jgi:hypothetical protein
VLSKSASVRNRRICSTSWGTSLASTASWRRTISVVDAVPCPTRGAKATTGLGVRNASSTVTPAPLVTTTLAAAMSSGMVDT